ncbi:MAG TPA: CDP-alcohol phosphatidyltransferase family protein [Phenylobacterium sp.]|uniref:CDP-alcohol phosphatidyltransferase family protein n=1 Tax=Phenylobacterium sp. TaxID=1871053 RepID=UPI002D0BC6DE|nr:CDP-alcohol phosphatidyltransferase family protein [Phenylobacterium sp.]HXA37383.1 CDP-alcohol phosphatidyltransferase family protein [Phenylobacterium sp.]
MRPPGLLSRLLTEGGAWKPANLVTLSRGLLIAPVLALLLAGWRWPALAVYGLAAATDLVDGWLARRSGQASAFGAQLDAAVDNVFSVAILAFLALDLPGVLERQATPLLILFGGPLAYLALSWLLRRRVLMFHFWSAKAGAVLLFCLWPLIAVTGWEGWIWIAAAVVGFSRLEQIVYILRGGQALNAPHGLAPVT